MFAECYQKVLSRLGQFQPSGNVLGKFFINHDVIYRFNIVPQNMKQLGIYKIKDGLHELEVEGKIM